MYKRTFTEEEKEASLDSLIEDLSKEPTDAELQAMPKEKRGNVIDICPNCGTKVLEDADEVALLLTPPRSTIMQKAAAPEVMVIVCPTCRILFFDKLNFDLIQNMKQEAVD